MNFEMTGKLSISKETEKFKPWSEKTYDSGWVKRRLLFNVECGDNKMCIRDSNMAKPSGLDFSNVSHVRVWHEQFEKIKNKGEFLIVEDKSNGKCVSFTRDRNEDRKPNESYVELKKLLEDTVEIVKLSLIHI